MDEEWDATAGPPARGLRPSDLEGIELRHAIPGRVRLRSPAIKGEPELSRQVRDHLASLPVARRVEVNPVTGSVLVVYDPADTAAIAQLGRLMIPGLDLDALPEPGAPIPADGPESGPGLADLVRRLNERLGAATGGVVDIKTLLPASLVVGGLARLIATRKLTSPAWYDFFWFAFGTYFTLNRGGGPEGSPPPPGERDDPEPSADRHGFADKPRNGTHRPAPPGGRGGRGRR